MVWRSLWERDIVSSILTTPTNSYPVCSMAEPLFYTQEIAVRFRYGVPFLASDDPGGRAGLLIRTW